MQIQNIFIELHFFSVRNHHHMLVSKIRILKSLRSINSVFYNKIKLYNEKCSNSIKKDFSFFVIFHVNHSKSLDAKKMCIVLPFQGNRIGSAAQLACAQLLRVPDPSPTAYRAHRALGAMCVAHSSETCPIARPTCPFATPHIDSK